MIPRASIDPRATPAPIVARGQAFKERVEMARAWRAGDPGLRYFRDRPVNMRSIRKGPVAIAVIIALVIGCAKDEDEPVNPDPPAPTSPVVFDLAAVPYDSLSTYHFFDGAIADMSPSTGVLPYGVITPLFSDHAHKTRFVWMPEGVHATYVSDSTILDFPDGAVLIKNFYYDHVLPADARRILETRLLYKKEGQWSFADYTWNEEQTEAVLDMNGSNVPLQWMDDGGIVHDEVFRIPSEAECHTCHKKSSANTPVGPKPQNLNMAYTYVGGAMQQLAKWEAVGYLQGGYPTTIETVAKWDDTTEDLTRRVRAYLDMNCAHCHSAGGHCDYRPMRLSWHETTDLANMGVCVPPDDQLLPELIHIVDAGSTERSMLYYRITSTDETVRMPLLGRTVVHQEAVDLIGAWINGLTPPCD